MLEIEQYISLFLEEKTKEMDEFKEFISQSDISNRKLSPKKWEIIYLNWAIGRKDSVKLPRILLSED